MDLLTWCAKTTGFGLLQTRRYTAQKGPYLLLAGQQTALVERSIYVALVDTTDEEEMTLLFQRHFKNPFEAGVAMLQVWSQVRRKTAQERQSKRYIRVEAPERGTPAPPSDPRHPGPSPASPPSGSSHTGR